VQLVDKTNRYDVVVAYDCGHFGRKDLLCGLSTSFKGRDEWAEFDALVLRLIGKWRRKD
jgi:hypothetical protein